MKLREMILVSFLAAMALVFNMLESALPMPLPGIKLGTANVFALAAIILIGAKAGFAVTLLRVVTAWLISANFFTFICSFTGGISAVLVMVLLYNNFKSCFSISGISVAGAWAFNIAQLAVASYIIGDVRVLWYIFSLLAAGTLSGWAVGYLAELLCGRIKFLWEGRR